MAAFGAPRLFALNKLVTVILLSGKKGSGKNATADIIRAECERQGIVYHEMAYADALKRACMVIFGLTYEQVYGDLKEVVDPYWGVTPRYILQKVGTEGFRNSIHQDVWVTVVLRKLYGISEAATERTVVAITDTRFPNELEVFSQFKEQGASVVGCRVERPLVNEAEQVRRDAGEEIHPSETALDGYEEWDVVLDNSGTLEDLGEMVRNKLSHVLAK